MYVAVTSTLENLEGDFRTMGREAPRKFRGVVLDNIRAGNDLAKGLARLTSGTHARKYPGTFSAQMRDTYTGFGATLYSGEYGPVARGQGHLAGILEHGTRNNPPHNNLTKSLDLIGPTFGDQAAEALHSMFWPDS